MNTREEMMEVMFNLNWQKKIKVTCSMVRDTNQQLNMNSTTHQYHHDFTVYQMLIRFHSMTANTWRGKDQIFHDAHIQ